MKNHFFFIFKKILNHHSNEITFKWIKNGEIGMTSVQLIYSGCNVTCTTIYAIFRVGFGFTHHKPKRPL